MERFINTLFEDKGKAQNLLEEIKKLGPEDRKFIDEKAVELEQIDNEISNDVQMNVNPNLNLGLKKLQMNILTLFLMSKIQNPDCSEEIRKIIMKFNKKIATVNEILEKNLNRISSSSNNQSSSSQSSNNQSSSSQSSNNQSSSSQSSNNQPSSSQSSNNQPSSSQSSNKSQNNEEPLSGLSKIQRNENQRKVTLNSKTDLINYLSNFNQEKGIDDNASSKKDVPPELKSNLLDGIDNQKYREVIEKIMKDVYKDKYTYANLFSLPTAVDEDFVDDQSGQSSSNNQGNQSSSNYQGETNTKAHSNTQAESSGAKIEDLSKFVGDFIKDNKLPGGPLDEDELDPSIKEKFISNPGIKNSKIIMDTIGNEPFTRAKLSEIRGLDNW
jgi:hypothetical protein